MEGKGWQTAHIARIHFPVSRCLRTSLLRAMRAQQRAPGTLGGELLRGHPVGLGFFLKRPTYVYFKKGKEGTVERKWLFGDLFSLQKRGGLDI